MDMMFDYGILVYVTVYTGGTMETGGKLRIVIGCATCIGSRALNEDNYLALVGEEAPCGTLGLLAVADGIGGLGTGASASQLALKTVGDVFSASCAIASSTMSDVPHLLRYSVQKANAAVFQAQLENKDLHGMGTTCVAATVTSEAIHIVSIGDSRAYLLRGAVLTRLTEDEWMKRHDGVTVVNRAVGWQPILPTEPISYEHKEDDILLLCTDGLTDILSDDEIRDILLTNDEGQRCTALIKASGDKPDSDNITVAVAKITRSQG